MTDKELLELRNNMLKEQNELIKHLTNEVNRLTAQNKKLEYALNERKDLSERLVNQILREHFKQGGHALCIEHSCITNDGRPIMYCYEEINNIDNTVLRALR